MLGEGEVRSSELKMALYSSEQDDSFKVSSQKTPFNALRVLYTLTEKDEYRIRKRFQLLHSNN